MMRPFETNEMKNEAIDSPARHSNAKTPRCKRYNHFVEPWELEVRCVLRSTSSNRLSCFRRPIATDRP